MWFIEYYAPFFIVNQPFQFKKTSNEKKGCERIFLYLAEN